jgi:hypothetical protein
MQLLFHTATTRTQLEDATMVDVYLMETRMREHKADVQRRAALQAALGELERSRRRNGETLVARLRRAVAALLPSRRVERMANR